jgi:hypothetical protein
MKKHIKTSSKKGRTVIGPVFPWENPVYTSFTLSNGKNYEYIVPIVDYKNNKAA